MESLSDDFCNEKSERVQKDPRYLLMKSHRVWDAEEQQSGSSTVKKRVKRVQASHRSCGQEE